MFTKSKILSVVGALLVAAVASQVHANMVQNPEFNDGLNHYVFSNPGMVSTSTAKSYGPPNSGLITFTSTEQGFGGYADIRQTVLSITGGEQYQMSVAVNFQNAGSPFIEVAWHDATSTLRVDYLLGGPQPADSNGWWLQSALFTAPAGAINTTLTIAAWGRSDISEGAPSGYLWVDSISVVPEPATLGLLGLGGLLLARRRHAKSGR